MRRCGVASLVVVLVVLWIAPVSTVDGPPLVAAVRAGEKTRIAALLKQGVDVNATGGDGQTALHWAVYLDDLETAAQLIRSGAEVGVVNDFGVSPLWLACMNSSTAVVDVLLQAGAEPNASLPSGETVLMAAARTGNVDVIRALRTRGADVNARESTKGQTALMWAVAEGHLEVVRTLIDNGARIDARSDGGFTPLLFSAREDRIAMVKLLLERGADVNKQDEAGETPLLVATVRGHVDIAKLLLERGADPNGGTAGYAPVHWASSIWESLVTRDYPAPTGEWRALAGIPSSRAKADLIKALIAYGADVNARLTVQPPRYGFSQMRTRFNKYFSGATPYYLAALAADADVMRLLLANGADPRLPNSIMATPLMMAAGTVRASDESVIPEQRYLEATQLAFDVAPDTLNLSDSEGNTAVHGAVMMGFDSVVQFLVDRGAHINAKNKKGETPLRIAEEFYLPGRGSAAQPRTAALLRRLGASLD